MLVRQPGRHRPSTRTPISYGGSVGHRNYPKSCCGLARAASGYRRCVHSPSESWCRPPGAGRSAGRPDGRGPIPTGPARGRPRSGKRPTATEPSRRWSTCGRGVTSLRPYATSGTSRGRSRPRSAGETPKRPRRAVRSWKMRPRRESFHRRVAPPASGSYWSPDQARHKSPHPGHCRSDHWPVQATADPTGPAAAAPDR